MSGIYWLASYPKSGNTWIRAFLANLLSDSDSPVDINAIRTGRIASARSWLDDILAVETSDLTQDEIDRVRPLAYDWLGGSEEVSYNKIHDAYRLPGNQGSVIGSNSTLGAVYILRNPLDLAVSWAAHFTCTIDDAIEQMGDPDRALSQSDDRLQPQVRQFIGTWSDHVQSWVDAPDISCHVVRYEDLQADPDTSFCRIAKFLKLAHDRKSIERAARFSRFQALADQEARNGFHERPYRSRRFFRSGKVGGWRDELTCRQVAKLVADHRPVMARFGYLDARGNPA